MVSERVSFCVLLMHSTPYVGFFSFIQLYAAGVSAGCGIINLTAMAHPTVGFHALSGFFAVYDMLNLTPRANLTKIWGNGQHLCTRSWDGLSGLAGQNCF